MQETLSFLAMKKFNNIEIYPYTELLDNPFGKSFHRGGPLWPDWELQKDIRHNIGGSVVDQKPEESAGPKLVFEENLYWCGAITGHFGHQITDFSSRIANYKNLEGKLCFAVHPRSNISRFDDCPPFFKEIISILGFSEKDIYIVSQPIIAKTLFVCPQKEQLGGIAPESKYLDILDGINQPIKREKKLGNYYISRAAQKTGRLAGESYIESFLGLCGYKVVRPETISLAEQIRIYKNAKKIVFSEGSAVHSLQLLGRNPVDVTILNRRQGTRIAENLLRHRVETLCYFNMGKLVYGLNKAGKPAQELGICVPSKEKLINFFNSQNIPFSQFNFDLFEMIVLNDIKVWLDNERNSQRNNPKSKLMIEKLIMEVLGSKSACIL